MDSLWLSGEDGDARRWSGIAFWSCLLPRKKNHYRKELTLFEGCKICSRMKGFHFISVDTYKINISLCRMSKSAQLVLATESNTARVGARVRVRFVFKVLWNGLLRYILHTCPNLWCNSLKVLRSGLLRHILHTCPNLWCDSCSKCYGMDCFGTYFTHVQTCDVTHVQSATEWTASVHTSHMSKPVT